MLTSKNYFVRLCLSLTVMSALALVASFAIQTAVSASSMRTSAGIRPSLLSPSNRPNGSGALPNDACDATGNSGCGITFSGTLAGALAATVGAATITPPTTLNGTAQTAPFTFTTNVADTRGAAASPWALSAASGGLTVSTVAGTTTDPFVVTNVTAACAATLSCSNATITSGTGSLSTTAGAYATAPTGGDIGTTVVTVTGNVPLGADTVGGAYSGTITITAGPTV